MYHYRLFLLGLGILPFAFWPEGDVMFEVPKVWFLYGWVSILILVSIFYLRSIPVKKLNLRILAITLSFLGLSWAASALGVDFQKSIVGNYYRKDGLLTYLYLISISLWMMIFWSKRLRVSLMQTIAMSNGVLSLWVLIRGIRYYLLGDVGASLWDGAIGVSFGQPNYLAGYLVVTMPAWFFLWKKYENLNLRRLIAILVVIQHISVGLTLSIGSLLFLPLIWVFLLGVVKKWSLQRWIMTLVLAISVFAIGYFGLMRGDGFVSESRERIYYKTWLGVVERPLLGYGWSNVDYAFEAVDWPISIDHDVYVDKAHMMLLEVLASVGIVGLLAYLTIIGMVMQRIWRGMRSPDDESRWWWGTWWLVMWLYLLHSQTNVISINEELIFWLAVGVVGSNSSEKP